MTKKLTTDVSQCVRVSVVTVIYNAASTVRPTLDSVLTQDYPNIEYIIIDGGSTDGTLDILEEYRGRVAHLSSGPDYGIYDAMNKGLAVATGKWVNFMNAGDSFPHNRVVSSALSQADEGDVVLYGAVEICYPHFKRVQKPGNLRRLWSGMQFSHQAAFISTKYHKAHPYDIGFRITADLHFFYHAYLHGVKFRELSALVASVNTGGVSELGRVRTILECASAVCDGRFRPAVRAYFLVRAFDAILRKILKRVLPYAVTRWLILHK